MRPSGLSGRGCASGLGTGTTAGRFIEALAKKHHAGMTVVCVPTSEPPAGWPKASACR